MIASSILRRTCAALLAVLNCVPAVHGETASGMEPVDTASDSNPATPGDLLIALTAQARSGDSGGGGDSDSGGSD